MSRPEKRNAKRKHREEILSRDFRIESIKQSVGIGVHHARGEAPFLDPHSWIEARGRFDEPLRDITEVEISVYPDPNADVAPGPPPCVGAIIRLKPTVLVVVPFTVQEFERLWVLATVSAIRRGHVAFTAPYWNRSLVVNLGFSTSQTAEDE